MQIVFLGTSCMQPTKQRNHAAILLVYKGEHMLLDCGEGTQRQLKIAGVKPAKITKLLITHWHGDHVLGVPGLLQTMGASEYQHKLKIYGPKGTKEKIDLLLKVFGAKDAVPFEVQEVDCGVFYRCGDYVLEAQPLKHNMPTVGYSFIEKDRRRINVAYVKKLGIPEGPVLGKLQSGKPVEWKGKKVDVDKATKIVKGKKVAYISDTVVCDGCGKLAEGADLLISEASFASDLADKAEEYMHLTAKDAALIANRAQVGKLVLTHFSQRYKNTLKIVEDAQDYFENVLCAEDFMKLAL